MALEIGHLATRAESELLVRLMTRVGADGQGPPPWRPADLDDLLRGRSDGLSTLRWLKHIRDRAQMLVPFDLHPTFDRLELDALARLDARHRVERELGAASDPVARLDERGRLSHASPGLAVLLGRGPEVLAGQHLAELCIGHRDASRVFDGLQMARREGAWSGPITITSPCGDPIPTTLRLTRRDDDGGRLWAHLDDQRTTRQRRLDQRVQTTRDPLTGLANPAALLGQLRVAIRRHRRSAERLALIHVAIDGLADLASTLGPRAHDVLVHTVGRRLRTALPECDDVGYLGQGRFLAVVERVDDPVGLGLHLGELHTALGQPVRHGAWHAEPRVSVGTALIPDDTHEKAELLQLAQVACDVARAEGGGRTRHASSALTEQVQRQAALIAAARQALAEDRLEVVLQPQVDLATGELVSAECLARWTDPQLGPVAPATFVPVFEQAGLATQLGRRVVTRALEAWAALDEAGLGVPRVSVNLSPAHLLDPDLVAALRDTADRTGVPLSRLEVELPSAALDHPELPTLLTHLAQLRLQGVSISLDDAGPDCLRLAQLADVPVDRMKIDGPHVAALHTGAPSQRAALDAMVTFARQAGLLLTAEGVEDPDTLRALREHQCPTAQGYALARPRSLARILADGWQVAA